MSCHAEEENKKLFMDKFFKIFYVILALNAIP